MKGRNLETMVRLMQGIKNGEFANLGDSFGSVRYVGSKDVYEAVKKQELVLNGYSRIADEINEQLKVAVSNPTYYATAPRLRGLYDLCSDAKIEAQIGDDVRLLGQLEEETFEEKKEEVFGKLEQLGVFYSDFDLWRDGDDISQEIVDVSLPYFILSNQKRVSTDKDFVSSFIKEVLDNYTSHRSSFNEDRLKIADSIMAFYCIKIGESLPDSGFMNEMEYVFNQNMVIELVLRGGIKLEKIVSRMKADGVDHLREYKRQMVIETIADFNNCGRMKRAIILGNKRPSSAPLEYEEVRDIAVKQIDYFKGILFRGENPHLFSDGDSKENLERKLETYRYIRDAVLDDHNFIKRFLGG